MAVVMKFLLRNVVDGYVHYRARDDRGTGGHMWTTNRERAEVYTELPAGWREEAMEVIGYENLPSTENHMNDIEKLRAAMSAGMDKLAGRGNYLPLGRHKVQIESFHFKAAGQKSPMGLFIAKFMVVETSSPTLDKSLSYSETFDPTKEGWEDRMSKFLLSALGVDWMDKTKIPPQARELAIDIRFSCQYESERAPLTAKYSQAPETFLVGRVLQTESTPYRTKGQKEIVSNLWSAVTA